MGLHMENHNSLWFGTKYVQMVGFSLLADHQNIDHTVASLFAEISVLPNSFISSSFIFLTINLITWYYVNH